MGQEQLNKVGSFGREDEAKLYREQVLTLLDEGHFLFGKLPVVRYDLSDPDMQGLIESIKAMGILTAGEAWHFEDTGTTHVIFGERRTVALNVVNQERIENDEDPIPMRYKIRIFKALTPAIEQDALARKADENNRSKQNDWLTVSFAVKRQLALGIDPGLVLARWPMIESEALMEKLAADNGITAAIPELQEALARGAIKVKRAVKIADLPLDQQLAAMTAPLRQKREGGPVSPVKVRKAGQAFVDTAKAHGIPGLDLAGIAAVLRFMGGDRTALDGMRQVKALIVEVIGEKAAESQDEQE